MVPLCCESEYEKKFTPKELELIEPMIIKTGENDGNDYEVKDKFSIPIGNVSSERNEHIVLWGNIFENYYIIPQSIL